MCIDTVCHPNYTGSIGFGQRFVQELVGQCGKLDVGDCISAIRHVISIGLAKEGPGQQFIQGGSHGGFLAAHRECTISLPFTRVY